MTMNGRFVVAFEETLRNDLDRRILIKLLEADREVRYEELRKAVEEKSSQTFKYAIDRLMRHAAMNRRLEEQGDRYLTHFSPTPRGKQIALILVNLGQRGSLPPDIPIQVKKDVQRVFLGSVPPDAASA